MPTWVIWIVAATALWVFAGLGVAWLFGAVCRLGGSGDEMLLKCRHGIPHGTVCGQCELYTMEPNLVTLRPEELEAGAK